MTRDQRSALDAVLPNGNVEEEAKRVGDLIVIDPWANRSSSSCECSSPSSSETYVKSDEILYLFRSAGDALSLDQ